MEKNNEIRELTKEEVLARGYKPLAMTEEAAQARGYVGRLPRIYHFPGGLRPIVKETEADE